MEPFGSPCCRSRPRVVLRIAMLAIGFAALVSGCARPPASSTSDAMRGSAQPAPPDSTGSAVVAAEVARRVPQSPAPGQVPRMLVYGGPLPGVVVTQAPPEHEEQPQPTVGYPSVLVACDSVGAIARRLLAVAVARVDSTIDMDFGLGRRPGCLLTASGKFAPLPPPPPNASPEAQEALTEHGKVGDALKQAGWAYLPQYQADGPDGESQGFRSRESLCIVRWSWDGGDDSDSTYVPSDDWGLEMACAPWEPGDSAR